MRVSLSIWLLLLTLPAMTWAEQPLRPFQVTYQTNLGPLSATAERSLSLGRDGNWLFQSRASVFGLTVTEQSTVALRANRIQSLRYEYVNPLSSKRNLSLRFDWAQRKLTDTLRGNTRDLPDGTFDRLGFQLQLQRDVCQGGAPFRVQDYLLADANKFKTYRIEYLSRETLKTKVGKLDTVKLRQYRPG